MIDGIAVNVRSIFGLSLGDERIVGRIESNKYIIKNKGGFMASRVKSEDDVNINNPKKKNIISIGFSAALPGKL